MATLDSQSPGKLKNAPLCVSAIQLFGIEHHIPGTCALTRAYIF